MQKPEAQVMVDEYENAHDTTALWSKVNAVNKAALSKSYECGMMSKETYDSVRDMYEFYILCVDLMKKRVLKHTLTLHISRVCSMHLSRKQREDALKQMIRCQPTIHGRGAIMQRNRNKLVKQKFLNFALNPSERPC